MEKTDIQYIPINLILFLKEKNHNYDIPFPSVSLINLSLNGLSFLNDSPLVHHNESIKSYKISRI